MKEILIALMIWIGANTNYNVDLSLPEVIRMDRAPLEYQYFQGKVPKNSDIHGFYNLKDKKITCECCIHHLWFNEKDYEKRLQIHKCNYEKNRNYLCMGLVIVGGIYVYNKLQTQYEVVGGLIENMEDNEEFLYKTSGGNNLISDTESYISDNE